MNTNSETFKGSITSIPFTEQRKSEEFYNFSKFLRENNYEIDFIDLNFLARLFFFFKHLGISNYQQIYEQILTILDFNFIKFLIFLEKNNFNLNSKKAFEQICNFIDHKVSQIDNLYSKFLDETQREELRPKEYILHDKGFFEIANYFHEKFGVDFSAGKHSLLRLLISLFNYNSSNTVENYANDFIEKRISTLILLLLPHLPDEIKLYIASEYKKKLIFYLCC